MSRPNPWRVAYLIPTGQIGMVAPGNLRFAAQEEAETVAARYRALPAEKRGAGDYLTVRLDVAGYIVERSDKPAMQEHPHYNRERFPHFVCQNGNWHIYADAAGKCASIPTQEAAADGCLATHFGDAAYVRATLGVDVLARI